jgi:hypothetical protein
MRRKSDRPACVTTRQRPDGSIELCYNSAQSMDRCSASRSPADGFWQFFILSIYCPLRTENSLYSMERIENRRNG